MNFSKLIINYCLLLAAFGLHAEEPDKHHQVFNCIKSKLDKKLPECVEMMAFKLAYREELNSNKKKRSHYRNNHVLSGDADVDKNALIRTMAQEADIPIITIPASQFAGSYPGEIFPVFRSIFETADKVTEEFNEPVIILIDMQDSELSDNDHVNLFRVIMYEQTLLSYNENVNVYVVATTSLDPDKKIFGKYSLRERFDGNICKIKQ